ncbi:MAG: hypothetical protein II920_08425, partial [Clostridia bacterium]|nr:hypothetical protein [Clostridia bacterium]
MKKVITLILALAMLLSVSAFAEDERITISVMGIDWGYGPSANSSMEQWWEDLFDVNLDIEWVNYNDYTEKANLMMTSQSVPDVIQIYKTEGLYYYPIFTSAID